MKQRITDQKWLMNEKHLLGKTLCVIDRGFNGIDPDTHQRTIRFSQTGYIIDITKVEIEGMKAVDWIYGKSGIYVESAPPLGADDSPAIGILECTYIDYCSNEKFNKREYYIMDREEAIAEIKEFNRMIVSNLYDIE
jgi:hypothetical protein